MSAISSPTAESGDMSFGDVSLYFFIRAFRFLTSIFRLEKSANTRTIIATQLTEEPVATSETDVSEQKTEIVLASGVSQNPFLALARRESEMSSREQSSPSPVYGVEMSTQNIVTSAFSTPPSSINRNPFIIPQMAVHSVDSDKSTSGWANLRVVETIGVVQTGSQSPKIVIHGDVYLMRSETHSVSDGPDSCSFIVASDKTNPAANMIVLSADDKVHHEPGLTSDLFVMDKECLQPGESTVIARYQSTEYVMSDASRIPVALDMAWKADSARISLLINYRIHESIQSGLDSLSLLLQLDPSAGDILNVQSVPSGAWNISKRRMLWKLENPASEGRVLARFAKKDLDGASASDISGNQSFGVVAVKFHAGCRQLWSGIDVVYANEHGDALQDNGDLAVRCEVMSGKYLIQ